MLLHPMVLTENTLLFFQIDLDNYTDTSLGKKIRDDYFQFLGLRTSYKDFDISNYLNFRKI